MITWDELTEKQKLEAARDIARNGGVFTQHRSRLPDRRERETVEIDHVWALGTAQEIHEPLLLSIGRYEDGRIGEVFIDGLEEARGKVSARTTALRQDVATLLSIALQYGAPIDVLRAAMGRAEVNIMGKALVVPHTIIGSVLDALAAEAG